MWFFKEVVFDGAIRGTIAIITFKAESKVNKNPVENNICIFCHDKTGGMCRMYFTFQTSSNFV